MRYIQGASWGNIAKEKHLSEDRIFQIHREAIAKLENSTVPLQ